MESRISATEAARSFSDLLNRVRYRGEQFVVERGGEPMCRIVPAGPAKFTLADLARLLETAPQPDAGYWNAVRKGIRRQGKLPKSPWQR
ncbi:MAG: type II toxin-antitoxin system prevent-host-death family antitoxin [Acidobacteriia bacterium]|nr:type II toxin-antitoxin system prevent-host-death family antitoxin [Terriglobia bacterium]